MRKKREENKNWDNMKNDGPMRIEDKTDKNWPKSPAKVFRLFCVFSDVLH
jgi:hypothetical protein